MRVAAVDARICAVVFARGRRVTLPWDERGKIPPKEAPVRDAWRVCDWASDMTFGAGVHVCGGLETACAPVHDSVKPVRRPANLYAVEELHGVTIPIAVGWVTERDVDTLDVLTHLLHDRADLRERLRDSERVARLARELSDGLMTRAMRPPVGGLGRDRVDIDTALTAAGFEHRYTRPLSWSEVPPLPEVVARTRGRLAQNPWREGRPPPPDNDIADLAKKLYLRVKPWPFSALVDP